MIPAYSKAIRTDACCFAGRGCWPPNTRAGSRPTTAHDKTNLREPLLTLSTPFVRKTSIRSRVRTDSGQWADLEACATLEEWRRLSSPMWKTQASSPSGGQQPRKSRHSRDAGGRAQDGPR